MRSRRRLKSDSLEVPERLLSRIKYRSTSTAYKVDNNRNKIDLCTICKQPSIRKVEDRERQVGFFLFFANDPPAHRARSIWSDSVPGGPNWHGLLDALPPLKLRKGPN